MTQTEVQLTSKHLACELEGGKNYQKNMHVHTQKVTLQMQFQHVTTYTGPLLYAQICCKITLPCFDITPWQTALKQKPDSTKRCNVIDTEAITLWASITLQLT